MEAILAIHCYKMTLATSASATCIMVSSLRLTVTLYIACDVDRPNANNFIMVEQHLRMP